jgi:adenylosuccinate lyase
MGYFKQKLVKTEVGSTAMPHKINPIYFEGAEGGFGIANGLLDFYCRKLTNTRLQRDLSDSTVRRSFGIALGYCLLSYQSINEALNRIEADHDNLKQDLEKHYEVVSEAIQNFLRTKNYKEAYDKTKQFFRGKEVNKDSIKKFIENLDIDYKDKQKLIGLNPEEYTGLAEEIVDKFL